MLLHASIGNNQLRKLIHTHQLKLGGNLKLKIYGSLSCVSGKRMLRKNRVFFQNEEEAIELGYRPCAHCLPEQFKKWKEKTARFRLKASA
jgi:methylphosphotriester-DNA--protein-cysteine methyltransferase